MGRITLSTVFIVPVVIVLLSTEVSAQQAQGQPRGQQPGSTSLKELIAKAVAAQEDQQRRNPDGWWPAARRSEAPYEAEARLFGKDSVERSYLLYPWASQQAARREYLIDEMNAAADRQQGHSYSFRFR